MICIHRESHGLGVLGAWGAGPNGMSWSEKNTGPKGQGSYDVVPNSECIQRNSWGDSESLNTCQLESKYTMGMHSRIAGWWKIMPKGKMKMPKSSAQLCQARPLALCWPKTPGPRLGYSSDNTKRETASSPLRRKLLGSVHMLLGFQI